MNEGPVELVATDPNHHRARTVCTMSAGMSVVPRALRCCSAPQPSRTSLQRRPILVRQFQTSTELLVIGPSADHASSWAAPPPPQQQRQQQQQRGSRRSYVSLSSSGRRTMATASGRSAEEDDTNRNAPTKQGEPLPTPATTPPPASSVTSSELIYESPLGHLVTRLRAVSLTTGLCGGLGVPLLLAAKGSSTAALASFDPSAGLLAIAMAFGTATVGSTVAVHYVFHPYAYSIERIPVRVCAYKQPPLPDEEVEDKDGGDVGPCDTGSAPASNQKPARDVLYKAVSRSLFLTRKETVFDPATDLVPYKGWRPLCNAVVKGHTLLYMHPDYVHDPILRRALTLNGDKKKPVVDVEKDDDFL